MRTTKNSAPNPRPLCASVSLCHIPQPAKAPHTTPHHRKAQNQPTAPQKPAPRHTPRLPCGTKPPAITTVVRKPIEVPATNRYNALQLFNSRSMRTRLSRSSRAGAKRTHFAKLQPSMHQFASGCAAQCSKIDCNRVISSAGVAPACFWRRTFGCDWGGVYHRSSRGSQDRRSRSWMIDPSLRHAGRSCALARAAATRGSCWPRLTSRFFPRLVNRCRASSTLR
jgi:hypothetical protein